MWRWRGGAETVTLHESGQPVVAGLRAAIVTAVPVSNGAGGPGRLA